MQNVENLLIQYVKNIFTLHPRNNKQMENLQDLRTNEDLNKQAKKMLINVYEQMFGLKLNGFMPLRNFEFKKAVIECISICDRYEDQRLKYEYIRNFK